MAPAGTLMAQRTAPWYNASTSLVDGLQTADAALEAAGLNWDVTLKPLRYDVYEGGKTVRKKSKAFSVIRGDNHEEIGVVGKKYRTLDNARAFRFLTQLVDDAGAVFDAAGCRKGGSQVFVVVKLPETIKVLGHDTMNQYVLFLTSHDGSLAVTATPSLMRIACTNMFRPLLAQKNEVWKAQHTTTLNSRIEDMQAVRRSLDLVGHGVSNFQNMAEKLVGLPVNGEDGPNGFYEAMRLGLPWEGTARDKLVEGVRHVWHTSGTIESDVKNTGWGLLNATTEYLDHYREYRTSGSRFDNIVFSLGARIEHNLMRGLIRRAA